MKRKRRQLSAEFKARVALEALKGIRTINDIAQENDVAPAQLSAWKKELEERHAEIFESKGKASRDLATFEKKQGRLERKIGQLVIEKEFLEKKCGELGI